jgi:hypothetical protein
MVHDLRVLLREHAGRKAQPSAVVLGCRTPQSTPESGARAGYDRAKRRKAPMCMRRSIPGASCWRCM